MCVSQLDAQALSYKGRSTRILKFILVGKNDNSRMDCDMHATVLEVISNLVDNRLEVVLKHSCAAEFKNYWAALILDRALYYARKKSAKRLKSKTPTPPSYAGGEEEVTNDMRAPTPGAPEPHAEPARGSDTHKKRKRREISPFSVDDLSSADGKPVCPQPQKKRCQPPSLVDHVPSDTDSEPSVTKGPEKEREPLVVDSYNQPVDSSGRDIHPSDQPAANEVAATDDAVIDMRHESHTQTVLPNDIEVTQPHQVCPLCIHSLHCLSVIIS